MIADYSQAMERTESAPKKKETKGLLSRLPFDSVVSSLSKLDGTKLKGKFGNTNNLSLVVNILLKDENQTLTDHNAKNEKKAAKKEVAKNKSLKVEENKKEITTKGTESRKKEEKTEKEKSNLTTVINSKNLKNDFNVVYKEAEREKENMPKWIKPKSINVGPNSVNITVDNTTVRELKAMGNKLEKVNIMTAGDKIEIQIPIDMEGQITNDPDAKVSFLNLQIVAKNQDKQKKPPTPINANITSNRRNYNTTAQKTPDLDKKSQLCSRSAEQPRKHSGRKLSSRSHNLPWWATSEKSAAKNKPPPPPLQLEDCMPDIYPSSPTMKVLASEEVTLRESKKADESAENIEPQERQRSSRRRKKLTGISRVTRHLEEELQELRKSEAKSATAERGKPSASPSSGVSAAKEDKGTEEAKKSTKAEKKETREGKKVEDKGPRSVRAVHNKSKFGMYTCSSVEKNDVEVAKKPNIPVMRRAADIIDRSGLKLNRREKINTTFILECAKKPEKVNQEPKINPLRPIEKRKDGTLIDYGLKVPTRKPRLRKPPPSKEITPKQTVSAPQQPKTNEFSQSKANTVSRKIDAQSSILQTRSELPLTKTSKLPTRKPVIREKNDCGGPGKSDNEIESNNKGDVESNSGVARRLATRAVDFLKYLKSRKTCNAEASIDLERPEKELIYSAWLNRFHTRKHPILIN